MLRTGHVMVVGVVATILALGVSHAPAAEDPKDEKIRQLQAERDKAKKERDELELQLMRLKLQLKMEEFERKQAQQQQEIEKLQREITEEKLKLDQMLADRAGMTVEEWRRATPERKYTIPLPLAPLFPKLDKVPADLRASITDVAGDLVKISVGLDAGLEVGTVLDVYCLEPDRLRPDGKLLRYLGTVKITSGLNLFPKQAIATFTPARGVPLEQLKPDELPQQGDLVRSKAGKQ